MAKVIESKVQSQTVNISRPIWTVILVGLAAGIAYWLLAKLFQHYNFSLDQSSNISTILTAVVGVVLLIVYRIEQPLVISVATAVCLWGLASLTNGLGTGEVLFWTLVLYGLGYAMFYWITRYRRITPVLILTLVIVLVIRLIAVM